MRNSPSIAPFMTVFVGLVVSASTLLLLIPVLFRPHEPWLAWAATGAGCLALAFGCGAMYLRPGRSR